MLAETLSCAFCRRLELRHGCSVPGGGRCRSVPGSPRSQPSPLWSRRDQARASPRMHGSTPASAWRRRGSSSRTTSATRSRSPTPVSRGSRSRGSSSSSTSTPTATARRSSSCAPGRRARNTAPPAVRGDAGQGGDLPLPDRPRLPVRRGRADGGAGLHASGRCVHGRPRDRARAGDAAHDRSRDAALVPGRPRRRRRVRVLDGEPSELDEFTDERKRAATVVA